MATPPFLPDESKPADADIISQYPAVERLFRDIVESWLLVDHDTSGRHPQLTLPERGSDPINAPNHGFLYTKNDAGDTELFYIDDGGAVVQLTEDGVIRGLAGTLHAPVGTKMLFPQASAPTGWTKDTDQHDKALRIVNTSGGGAAGNTEFTSVFGSGKTAGDHILTIAEMPSNTHTSPHLRNMADQPAGATESGEPGVGPATGATGGDAAHNHTLSLDLQYVDVIKATKD